MEIKTAFSSQFNHDAAIRGFWCAEHVCYSRLPSTRETERKREISAAYHKSEVYTPYNAHINQILSKERNITSVFCCTSRFWYWYSMSGTNTTSHPNTGCDICCPLPVWVKSIDVISTVSTATGSGAPRLSSGCGMQHLHGGGKQNGT